MEFLIKFLLVLTVSGLVGWALACTINTHEARRPGRKRILERATWWTWPGVRIRLRYRAGRVWWFMRNGPLWPPFSKKPRAYLFRLLRHKVCVLLAWLRIRRFPVHCIYCLAKTGWAPHRWMTEDCCVKCAADAQGLSSESVEDYATHIGPVVDTAQRKGRGKPVVVPLALPRSRYTCNDCPSRFTCSFAWDDYNTDGDCLEMK